MHVVPDPRACCGLTRQLNVTLQYVSVGTEQNNGYCRSCGRSCKDVKSAEQKVASHSSVPLLNVLSLLEPSCWRLCSTLIWVVWSEVCGRGVASQWSGCSPKVSQPWMLPSCLSSCCLCHRALTCSSSPMATSADAGKSDAERRLHQCSRFLSNLRRPTINMH